MREYQLLLQEYAHSDYAILTQTTSRSDWGNMHTARHYLEKYWLKQEEYKTVWKPIQDQIFINPKKGLPAMVFAPKYSVMPIYGGDLFTKEDFKQLQKCILSIGDKNIIVVQNHRVQKIQSPPPFRMKFPSDISWKELMSGNFISTVLVEFDDYDYFVFSESATWAKYLSNAYRHSLDIIGFEHRYASLFKRTFALPLDNREELRSWLPEAYKNRVI